MGATPKVFGNPLHPYTQMLLAAVPQLHSKWAEGSADAAGWDQEVSDSAAGPLVEVEPDHLVASDESMSRAGAQPQTAQGGENR